MAVVGRTGAGKSSIYQLVLAFRYANKGTLFIEETDISNITLQHLRGKISVVL